MATTRRQDRAGAGAERAGLGGRPRLVHVTTTDISLALLLGPQLEAFADAGYDVITASAPGPFVERLRAAGIDHIPLRHATRAMAPQHDLAALAELTALFRRLRPDIVHTHNPKPGIYGRLAARAAGVPVVVNTVHGLYATPDDSWRRRAAVYGLERLAATCSGAELVQNPEDVATLRRLRVPADRLTLLGNGIDLSRFHPDDDDRAALREELGYGTGDLVVGVVGRLVWEKGYREVFDAAVALRQRRPEVRFVVAGPADHSKADAVDADEMRRAEAAGGVRFLGHRDDVERLYRAMDLYVLASYREGFPRSAMEAAASGLPVVATDIRGCRQVVDDGVTGRLVPPRDAAALAAAVEALAADPAGREAMGRAALARAAADFDQRRVIATTLRTYRHLLGWEPSPGPSSPTPVEHAGDSDIPAAAALHAGQITGGFLASLGTPFLTRLYRRAARHDRSFVLVARDDAGEVGGFLVGTEDTGSLYRAFLCHDGIGAAAGAAPRLALRWRSVLETLRYGRAATDETGTGAKAELLAMAVRPDLRGRGTGRALVDAFFGELERRGVTEARVVVGEPHTAARRLYEAAGFRPVATITVHGDRASAVLAWP